LGFSVCYLMFW